MLSGIPFTVPPDIKYLCSYTNYTCNYNVTTEDTDASQEYMLYEMYITFSIYSPKETSVYFQISLRSFLFYFCLTVSGCVLISCIHYLGFRMCGKPTSLMGPNHQQMFNLFPIRRLPTLIPQKSA